MDYVKIIGENLIPVVFAILTPILLLLVKRFVSYLEKKWDYQVAESQEKKLLDLIARAIAYAEETAMAALKSGEELPEGAQKLDSALEFAAEEIGRMGLDKLATDKLTKLIESALNKQREEGAVPRTLKGSKAKKLLVEG